MEPPGNNNQVYQERLLSDQEFNSFEDNDQKVILVKTGVTSTKTLFIGFSVNYKKDTT